MKEGRACERNRIHRRDCFRLPCCKRLQGSLHRMAHERTTSPVHWAS